MATTDPSLGWAAIDWIETYLVHGPGDVQGQPIELDDEFAAFIVKAYRVDPVDGARPVRRAFLSRPKGRSKSGLAGFIECFEALGPCRFDHWAEEGEISDWGYEYEPGEPVGKPLTYVEILNVATEEGQAGNTYDGVFYMLNPDTASPELVADYGRIDVGLTRINLPNRRGFIEPVTASNESKDGGKSTFIVADETHLWIPPMTGNHKLGKMHQTMVRNLLKRKQASGWMLETSTMYAEGEKSVAEGTHAYAKSGKADGKLLFDHKQASMHWDLNKRSERIEALKQAYGPASAWMDLDAIADYWDDPQASEGEFRRFFLNQPVPLTEKPPTIIDSELWATKLLNRKAQPPSSVTLVIHVAADRSRSSIGVAGEVDGKTLIMSHTKAGTDWVAPAAAELVRAQDVREVALFQRSQAASLIPDLVAHGVEFEKLPSTDMGASCAAIQEMAKREELIHIGQPELTEAMTNALTRYVGEVEVWDTRDLFGPDVSPFIACAAAAYRLGLLSRTYDVLSSVY